MIQSFGRNCYSYCFLVLSLHVLVDPREVFIVHRSIYKFRATGLDAASSVAIVTVTVTVTVTLVVFGVC